MAARRGTCSERRCLAPTPDPPAVWASPDASSSLLFFDAVTRWLETEGSRGCPYLNTSVEITDPAHPARAVVREYLAEISAYLRELLVEARYADADRRAMELHALLTGAISLAVAHQTSAFAVTARRAAERLLD